MKRVCFLLYNLDPGGLETHLLRFIQFAGNDFKSIVIVKKGVDGTLSQAFLKEGVELKFIKTGYLNVAGWSQVLKLFKRERFDSVCDFTSNFSGIYMFLAWLANVPVRIAYYGQSTHHYKRKFFRNVYDRFVNFLVQCFSTNIIFNSRVALEFFFPGKNEDGAKYRVIYNGIDANLFSKETLYKGNIRNELGLPAEAILIIHTGRYDEKKNQKAVLSLASILVEKFPLVYFIVCGKGTEKFNERIETGLKDRFFALGYRDDVPAILKQGNAFYFPSYTESQPNSLIEAMLAGLPFVASNIEPIKESVPSSYHTQLVDADDITAAASKFEEIICGECKLDFRQLSLWAARHFDAAIRFKEFKKVLLDTAP